MALSFSLSPLLSELSSGIKKQPSRTWPEESREGRVPPTRLRVQNVTNTPHKNCGTSKKANAEPQNSTFERRVNCKGSTRRSTTRCVFFLSPSYSILLFSIIFLHFPTSLKRRCAKRYHFCKYERTVRKDRRKPERK